MPGLSAKHIIDCAANIICRKLIEEGILGKTLNATYGIRTARIHMIPASCSSQPVIKESTVSIQYSEPPTIWKPACIDTDTWNAMLGILGHKNMPLTRWLKRAIQKDIITVAENGVLSVSDIIAEIQQLPLAGHTFLKTETDLYYFDENLICQNRPLTDEEKCHLPKYRTSLDSYNIIRDIMPLRNTWLSAVLQFKSGMTPEQWIPIMLTVEKIPQSEIFPSWDNEKSYTHFERVIQTIRNPVFGRTPENTNTKTFDWIRVEVTISRYLYETRKELIQQLTHYRPFIDRMILNKIQSTKRFQNMGIPINCLRLTSCVLTNDFILEYLFDLKTLPSSERKEPTRHDGNRPDAHHFHSPHQPQNPRPAGRAAGHRNSG